MQIHELTKRKKRTDEGLLDGIKNAVTAAKTGFQTASDAYSTNQRVSDQETRNANAAKIARQMAARGYNVDTSDPTVKRNGQTQVAGGTITSVMADNELKKAVVDATNKFKATPEFATIIGDSPTNTAATTKSPNDIMAVLPDPGHALSVTTKGGEPALKDINGVWKISNQPVTNPNSIAYLESLIDQDQYKQVIAPTAPTQSTPATQKKPPVQKTAPVKPVAEGSLAQRSAARNAQTTQSISTPAAAQQPAATDIKTIDASLTNAENRPAVKSIFDKFSKEFETTPAEVKNRPEVKQAWDNLVKVSSAKVKQGKDERMTKAFQAYASAVLSAMKAVGTGEEGNTGEPADDTASAIAGSTTTASPAQQAQATQQLAKVSGVDPQTINKVKTAVQKNQAVKPIAKQAIGLDEQLSRELSKLKFLTLYEDSVQITKDIVVKTNLGNYVKKADDQTWYDPNGIPIDPVKYADYIKKLDATPAAQTRYQADSLSGRGSDTAYNKARAPAQPPEQLDPAVHNEPVPDFSQQEALARLKQMQDYNQIQATLRSNNVEGLNSLVMDTFNQLQNAKIFKTGQEDYLRDRMGALMAMKAG